MVATKKKTKTEKVAGKSSVIMPDSPGVSKNESSEMWGSEIEQLKGRTFSSLEEAVSELASIIGSRMNRVPTAEASPLEIDEIEGALPEVAALDAEDERNFLVDLILLDPELCDILRKELKILSR